MQINQVSVVIPVRNEEGNVASLIGEIDVALTSVGSGDDPSAGRNLVLERALEHLSFRAHVRQRQVFFV